MTANGDRHDLESITTDRTKWTLELIKDWFTGFGLPDIGESIDAWSDSLAIFGTYVTQMPNPLHRRLKRSWNRNWYGFIRLGWGVPEVRSGFVSGFD